jgi:hypothetical protein
LTKETYTPRQLTDDIQVIGLETLQTPLYTSPQQVFIQYMIFLPRTILSALGNDAVLVPRELVFERVEAFPENNFRRMIVRCGIERCDTVPKSQTSHPEVE